MRLAAGYGIRCTTSATSRPSNESLCAGTHSPAASRPFLPPTSRLTTRWCTFLLAPTYTPTHPLPGLLPPFSCANESFNDPLVRFPFGTRPTHPLPGHLPPFSCTNESLNDSLVRFPFGTRPTQLPTSHCDSLASFRHSSGHL